MSLIAYIQKDYHRWKIDKIAIFLANKEKKRIEDFKVKVILQDNFSFKDLFDKKRYKYFVGCNVDDLNFQLLFKFLKYEKFYTFDEGQRNLDIKDKYYSQNFSIKKQKKFYFLNKLFGFPKVFKSFYKKNSHITFYDPNYFNHPLKKDGILIFLPRNDSYKKITKIFIGVSSNWIYSHKDDLLNKPDYINQKIKEASEKVNNLSPDIYILHPGEDGKLIRSLDKNITIINCPNGSEDFINKLSINNDIEVFTEKSGIIFDLKKDINVTFIDLFDRFTKNEYDQFKDNFNKFRESL